MVSVESIVDQLPGRIQEVKDHVGIELVAGCEDDHLVLLVSLTKAFKSVGPDIDPSINLFSIWKRHSQNSVWGFLLYVVNAMYKSLVQIKNQHLLLSLWVLWRW